MSTIHLNQTTTSTPEQFIAGLTDFGPGGDSGHTYTFTSRPEVDAVVVREGKNLNGRVLGFVLGAVGKRVLAKEFAKTVKAIEARSYGAGTAGSRTPSMAELC